MKVTGSLVSQSCLVSQSHAGELWLSCQELVALPHRIPSPSLGLLGAAGLMDGHLLLAELLDTLRVLPVPPCLCPWLSGWYRTAHPPKLLDWASFLSHTSVGDGHGVPELGGVCLSPGRRATALKRWWFPGLAQVRRRRKRELLAVGICSIRLLEM